MICTQKGDKGFCSKDWGGPLTVLENGRYVLVGIVSSSWGDCPSKLPYVYGRVTSRKYWIKRKTNRTQDSDCHLEPASTEDPTMKATNSNPDEKPTPIELTVGVSASTTMVMIVIAGVCCWRSEKCRKYTSSTDVVEANPDYGDDYYDKNNYDTKVVDECNYYGDEDDDENDK